MLTCPVQVLISHLSLPSMESRRWAVGVQRREVYKLLEVRDIVQ